MSKYSPQMDEQSCKKLLLDEDTGYLGLASDGIPYVVPVSYALIEDVIVIHCALRGKKLDVLGKNSKVSFAVSRHPDRMTPHHAESGCTYRYESVIVSGTAKILATPEERLPWLVKFKEFFDKRLDQDSEANPVTIKAAEKCGCILISMDELTGRATTEKT